MKKFFLVSVLTLSLLIISSSLLVHTARAVCPVCTVAVIAGLGVSRALGIDDIVSSIWIGGLILSTSFWLIDWLKKKKFYDRFNSSMVRRFISPLIIILMYLLVLVPLKLNHSIGIALNRLWGIDKIILGTAIGSAVFATGMWADKKVRKVHGGKQLFIYQKVVFPVAALVILSVVFYFVTRR